MNQSAVVCCLAGTSLKLFIEIGEFPSQISLTQETKLSPLPWPRLNDV